MSEVAVKAEQAIASLQRGADGYLIVPVHQPDTIVALFEAVRGDKAARADLIDGSLHTIGRIDAITAWTAAYTTHEAVLAGELVADPKDKRDGAMKPGKWAEAKGVSASTITLRRRLGRLAHDGLRAIGPDGQPTREWKLLSGKALANDGNIGAPLIDADKGFAVVKAYLDENYADDGSVIVKSTATETSVDTGTGDTGSTDTGTGEQSGTTDTGTTDTGEQSGEQGPTDKRAATPDDGSSWTIASTRPSNVLERIALFGSVLSKHVEREVDEVKRAEIREALLSVVALFDPAPVPAKPAPKPRAPRKAAASK